MQDHRQLTILENFLSTIGEYIDKVMLSYLSLEIQ
jgi:hypothetical protein